MVAKFEGCPLCNKENYEVIYMLNEQSIVKCKECEMVYLNKRRLFSTETDNTELEKIIPQENINKWEEPSFNNRLKKVYKFKKNGRLLDIGCGEGFFLKLAKDKGFEVYGVDTDAKSVYIAQKYVDNKIKKGTVSSCNFSSKFFDVITLWHVIEHFPSPIDDLLEIRKVLKEDGFLFIETPNFNSFKSKLERKNWWYIREEHQLYFTPSTLKKILERTNFKVIRIEPAGGVGILHEFKKKKIFDTYESMKYLKYIRWVKNVFSFFSQKLYISDSILAVAT